MLRSAIEGWFFVVFFCCRLRWSTPLKTLWISKCVYKTQPHVQKILCHIWTKIVPTRRFVCSCSLCLTPSDQNPTMCRSHRSRVQEGECEFFSSLNVLLQLHLEKLDCNPGGAELKSSDPAHLFICSRSVQVLSGCIFRNTAFHVWPQSFFHARMDHGSYFWIFVLKVYSHPSSVASCRCNYVIIWFMLTSGCRIN